MSRPPAAPIMLPAPPPDAAPAAPPPPAASGPPGFATDPQCPMMSSLLLESPVSQGGGAHLLRV